MADTCTHMGGIRDVAPSALGCEKSLRACGRDEIDHIAGVIKATHPDFQYQALSPTEEVDDGCRVRWVSGSPGKPPSYAGTDFIVARDGKIAAVYLFFDKLPS